MSGRFWLAGLAVIFSAASAAAQAPGGSGWRTSDGSVVGPAAATSIRAASANGPTGFDPVAPVSANMPLAAAAPAARSTSPGELPHDHGQLWRKYDISPYTLRVAATNRPEQAIVDWVLRETGYEAWHSEPFGVLSASPRELLVYHTPEMQSAVADIVERFVSSEAETHAFGLRVTTVNHPNWRTKAQRLLRSVPVQTPGVEAWLMAREDAAVLLAELQRRSDYREHSSPHLLVANGQSTVVAATRTKNYIREVVAKPGAWPGFEPQTGVIDEGYSLEFSPLLSVDSRTIDATIKCEINQVEKMVGVPIDVPTQTAPRQRAQIEVPQMSHFHFHERFRWPVDQVLLVGMGMVPAPVPMEGPSLIPGVPLPLPSGPARSDLLIFIESKGKTGLPARVTAAAAPRSTY